ncbi:MAG TPA: ATP-dependent zinc metalloprotease FtsH [Mycobacteriales bacterium]
MADTARPRPDRATDRADPRPASGPGRGSSNAQPWRVEGARPGGSGDRGDSPWRRTFRRFGLLWVVVALFVLNWALATAFVTPSQPKDVPYSYFRAQVQAGNVTEVTAVGDAIDGTFKAPTTPPGDGSKALTTFSTHRPDFASDDQLAKLLADKGVTVSAKPPPGPSLLERILLSFGPTLLLIGLVLLWARRAGSGGATGLGRLGSSRAKRYEPETGTRTTFADVAGIDEVAGEVAEIVDFLRNPQRYRRLGAAMPKGILLAGPPGTGKTLLARAVAGEADVPFYSVSASEFIEMIVGVGASRVRDLFEQAKTHAPSIIFIDELDAIGRARGGSMSIGGHDEREQTLNQLLTEMDGFTGREDIVVLAATNRPEILDSALLRAGRFDRRLMINPPDMKGRREILDVHVRSVPLDADVDLDVVAAATPGMVGADLKNLVNEAVLVTAGRDGDHVRLRDFTDALSKIQLGSERRIVISADERRRTAYHEAGHALLGLLTPGADPVRKISIVPRGHALGVTFSSPDSDRYFHSEPYLRGRIAAMLAGRAAEHLVFGDVTTGAESDLEQATALARQMVGRWGMSEEIGAMSVLPNPRHGQPSVFDASGTSPATQELVEAEARRLLERCATEALDVLTRERARLDGLVAALLEAETLDEGDIYRASGLPVPQPVSPA